MFYRLKNLRNRIRIERHLRPLRDLPPKPVATQNLAAEAHLLVGRAHLSMAGACLHTFFAHSGLSNRVGLTIHLDATVGSRGRRWLEMRFPGVRCIPHHAPDPKLPAMLAPYPVCRSYYQRVLMMTKLFQVLALCRHRRVILLDSDMIFHCRPQALIDWVDAPESQPSPPRYLRESDDATDRDPGTAAREKFDEIISRISLVAPDLASNLRIPHFSFNAGLLAFDTTRVSLPIVEAWLGWLEANPNLKLGRWFTPWCCEQTAYMLNFATWRDALPFDMADYACGPGPARICNHFLSPHYHKPQCLQRVTAALEACKSL